VKHMTTATPAVIRRSPIEPWLAAHGAQWAPLGEGLVAARVADPAVEAARLGAAALCDLSVLPKLGLKGPGAAEWLRGQGIEVPGEIYGGAPLPRGGLVIRTGAAEFFLECDEKGDGRLFFKTSVPFFAERQDATFLVCGPRTFELFAQTCGVEVAAAPPRRLIYARVAGVNCALWPDEVAGRPALRLWVDPSYALSLWESLVEIAEELGGGAVGATAISAPAPGVSVRSIPGD
jgi:sarcosine oxidase subunit gamma